MARRCSVLQCAAVCCSMLRCVAVCCGVLQWRADLVKQPAASSAFALGVCVCRCVFACARVCFLVRERKRESVCVCV